LSTRAPLIFSPFPFKRGQFYFTSV
jgi:hypothetical protein